MGFGNSGSSGTASKPRWMDKGQTTQPTPPPAPIYSTMTPDYTAVLIAAQRKKRQSMGFGKTILGGAKQSTGQAPIATKTLLGQ